MAYGKPLPSESIRKHLAMLARYCKERGDDQDPRHRSNLAVATAFLEIARRLERLANSRPIAKLLNYGE